MRRNVIVRLSITLSLAVLVAVLSVTPGAATHDDAGFSWLIGMTPPPLQKLMHVLAYGILTLAWDWTLAIRLRRRRQRALLAMFLAIGEGILLEWWQTQVPGRFGTLTDVLLNAAGVVLGVLASLALL